jgi:hypothetical protein
MLKTTSVLIALISPFLITGCYKAPSPNNTVDTSHFEQLKENKDFHPINVGENEKRYTSQVGVSAFGHVSDSEKIAMKRANAFCSKSDKKMVAIGEHIVKPPYMINHYPSVTLTFVCQSNKLKKEKYAQKRATANIEFQKKIESSKELHRKYDDLIMLKKLLDSKILTKQEFEKEKKKILDRE